MAHEDDGALVLLEGLDQHLEDRSQSLESSLNLYMRVGTFVLILLGGFGFGYIHQILRGVIENAMSSHLRSDEFSRRLEAKVEQVAQEAREPILEASKEETRQLARRLIDEFGMTHQAVSEAVGRSRASVSNLLRLLELTPEVREHIHNGALEMGHARALAALPADQQNAVAARVVARGLSVRATESLVRKALEGDAEQTPRQREPDPDIRRLQDDLADRLGASVSIQQGRQGKGKLVIQYSSLDELDGIIERIR